MPREGHDRGCRLDYAREWAFQSTCPARGTTVLRNTLASAATDFNPRAPRGARRIRRHDAGSVVLFQSTCPARGTTLYAVQESRKLIISIHVPREGHDRLYLYADARYQTISIHVPREGHDRPQMLPTAQRLLFQSTCPARGTTSSNPQTVNSIIFQSTCPARGTTKTATAGACTPKPFQSTCPARGTTMMMVTLSSVGSTFQSTCPARGTTQRHIG